MSESAAADAPEQVREEVKDFYTKIKNVDDFTNFVCPRGEKPPSHVQEAMDLIHEEVKTKYYGCGPVFPECLEGMYVLDLGCGTGHDCYILSKLVSEDGHVTGIDMTDEALGVAKKHVDYHMEAFGYQQPNVEFVKGYIENLREAGLEDDSYDIVVSNCVVNLSPDKKKVLTEAYRVLKEGGELYFSDMYADREVPEDVRKNKTLWGDGYSAALCWRDLAKLAKEVGFSTPRLVQAGRIEITDPKVQELLGECIAGALYWKDFINIAKEIGFCTPRLVHASRLEVKPECQKIIGDLKYVSATYRLFKLLDDREEACEVIYDGSVTGHEEHLKFDWNHVFAAGATVSIDSELATILMTSRFEDDFTFQPAIKKPAVSGDASGSLDVEVDPFEYTEDVIDLTEDTKPKKPCCVETIDLSDDSRDKTEKEAESIDLTTDAKDKSESSTEEAKTECSQETTEPDSTENNTNTDSAKQDQAEAQ